MSYRNCISNGIKEGLINEEQAAKQLELLEGLERTYKGQGMDPTEASKKAAKEAYEALKRDAIEKKRDLLLQKKVQDDATVRLKTYTNANGEVDYAKAGQSIYAMDNMSPDFNVEKLIDVEKHFIAKMAKDILYQLRMGLGGTRTKQQLATMKDMMREIFNPGSTTNKNAAMLAKAWKEISDHLRLRFNKFGGKIRTRIDWGMSQIHDTLLVRKVAVEEWIDFILPKLAIRKMIDESTGLPFNAATIRLALREVYESISTEGMASFKPKGTHLGIKLANRRLDHRFLAFNNADDWMAYQARFGVSDPFVNMMGHINGMTRDIALMRLLGPNPDAFHTWLKGMVRKQSKLDTVKEAQGTFKRKKMVMKWRSEDDRTASMLNTLDNLFAHHKNQLQRPVDGTWARTLASTRQILTSAQLGSAAIMALGDFNWSRITAKFNGLPAHRANRQSLKLLKELIKKDRSYAKLALRLGLIAEHWTTIAGVAARYSDVLDAPMWSKRVSDVVLRASGLSDLTQSGRWGFGMAAMGELADQVGKTFKQLDSKLQAMLKRYGINEGDWNIIRKTKLYDAGIDDVKFANKGMYFLRPDDIHARADLPDGLRDTLATKLMSMISTETEFAVPTSSAKGRVIATGKNQPGTLQGELLFSALMYKNFAITLGFTHLARGIQKNGAIGKLGYLSNVAITGAIMGALAYELKEISKGRDPTAASEMGFRYWLNALVHGGGMGIFGDLLYADTSEYQTGLAKSIAGPVVSLFSDIIKLTVGNAIQLAAGEKTNAGKEMADFVQNYTPGSSIWYLRLAFERFIIDTIQRMIDPEFDNRNRRNTKRWLKKGSQEYWWSPGEVLPSKLPELSNIMN